jgi:hypothetical protein
MAENEKGMGPEAQKKVHTAIPEPEDVEGHGKAKGHWDGGPEGLKKAHTAIPGDENAEEDVEGHKAKSKWDGEPEGVARRGHLNIPDGAEDDVEGHRAKSKWDGEPEGVARRGHLNIPDSAEDDVEGHSFDLPRGGELIDRRLPGGGDSPHGEGAIAKQKL